MKILTKYYLNLSHALVGLLFSQYAMATCTISVAAKNVTAPLFYKGSFTVGSDNNSAQLYNQFNNSAVTSFTCTRGPYNRKMTITGKLANGFSNVFETGVAGIGVKFVGHNGNNSAQLTGPYSTNANNTGRLNPGVHAVFVRTGEVGGGAIMGTSMPVIRQYISDADGDVLFNTLNYSGSIPIVAASCRTPDFSYNLGTFSSGVFTGVNSTTAWVDTSIKLDSCSPFYGYLSGGYYSSSTGGSGKTMSKNILTMMLSPVTTVINPASGIIGLDITEQKAAGGIGIQLGTQSGGSFTPLNLATPLSVSPMLNDTSGVVRFKLGARYIQTKPTISPGTANASVVYTINYK